MIKKVLLRVALLQLICNAINAQQLPPVYEIRTDSGLIQTLSSDSWQLLPDKTGTWTIDDVKKAPLTDNFFSRDSASKKKDTIANTYWIRYRLKNEMNKVAEFSLDSYSEQDDFYVLDSTGASTHYMTGHKIPWQKKDGLRLNNYIPLRLAPGEQVTVYDKAYNRIQGLPNNFGVDIVNTAKSIAKDYVDEVEYKVSESVIFNIWELQESFLVGVLFIAMLINFFSFLTVKEKEYLYFSLLLFFLMTDRLINPFSSYWYYNKPFLEEKIGYLNLSWSFIALFLVQFTRYFFKLSQTYPRLSKYLLIIGYVAFISIAVCDFADPDFGFGNSTHPFWAFFYSILLSIISLSVIAVFFLHLRQKSQVNRLVIIGGFPLLCLYGIFQPYSSFAFFRNKQYGTPIPVFFEWIPFRTLEIIFVAWFVILFSFILFLRFNQLRKENAKIALDKERLAKEKETERALLIEEQKVQLEIQVAERTTELTQSLEELKATQAQLVQSEKMASLGQLTAGIAHEIQNPLNFVNNFSDVNKEMLLELKEEMDRRNYDDAQAILGDLMKNEEKINHHGKRAEGIVKNMLEHSRQGTGTKQPTAINALADEYLKLAYYGIRAKNTDFSATLHTDYDESIGNVNIIPQDIGRVLLNLYNNAFYAVAEKMKTNDGGYTPEIFIATHKTGNTIEIRVRDNGTGIPQAIIDKIFQPFFTTKPTGQGTGLGLSLSYDIIFKTHKGQLKVDSTEGEGSTFIIRLPV